MLKICLSCFFLAKITTTFLTEEKPQTALGITAQPRKTLKKAVLLAYSKHFYYFCTINPNHYQIMEEPFFGTKPEFATIGR